MIPNVTEITKRLIVEQDALRLFSPTNPHIQELKAQINHNIAESNRQKWQLNNAPINVTLHVCGALSNSLMANVSNHPSNHPITFSSKWLTRYREIATAFVKQFASPVRHFRHPSAWIVKRSGRFLRNVRLIILYPASLLIFFFCRLLKAAAILLLLEQMASPYTTSKT